MAVSESKKRANTKWDKENMRIASCSLTKAEHAAFKAYAEQNGKTISGMLLHYIRSCIAETAEQHETTERKSPVEQIITAEHTRKIRRRGFTLGDKQFKTIEKLQEFLHSIDVEVSNNIILNWISKKRLSKENTQKYPVLLNIGTYEYMEDI